MTNSDAWLDEEKRRARGFFDVNGAQRGARRPQVSAVPTRQLATESRRVELVERDLLERSDQRPLQTQLVARTLVSPSDRGSRPVTSQTRRAPRDSSRPCWRGSGRRSRDRACPPRCRRSGSDRRRRLHRARPGFADRDDDLDARLPAAALSMPARTSRAMTSIGLPNHAPFSG